KPWDAPSRAQHRAASGSTMGERQWLAWLCLSRMCYGFIFMAYAGALPLLMKDWSMSAGDAGLIHSGWHLGYLLSLFGVGFLTHRLGAKRTFLLTGFAACLTAWMFALFASGFHSALALFALTGLCSGGSYTPGLTLIAERVPPERRGNAMGWYLAASSMGYALSLLAGSRLIAEFGWRAGFFAAASGPVIGLLISFHVLRSSRNIVAHHHAIGNGIYRLLEVWRNRPAMLAIWSYAFHSWELLGLWAWLPAFLAAAASRQYAASEAVTVGLTLSAISFATNTVGSVAAGTLSDRLGRTTIMMSLTVTSLLCSFIFGWLIAAPLWLVAAVAVVYNLAALGDSSVYSTALTELVPPPLLGIAYSLRSAIGFGLGAISPLVFGLVLDAFTELSGERGAIAWGMAWVSLGVGALAGPFVIVALSRSKAPRVNTTVPI
ncbi:MAG: MFS transporter, partial [Betaproteobacteria bacterium]